MKDFLKKIKTDKKTRNTVICAGIGAVIVIAAAVAIPIGVHSSNVQKVLAAEEAAQAAGSDEANVTEDDAAAAEPETEESTAEVTASTAAEPTQAANGGTDTNKGTASNTGKDGSSGNNSGSGSSGSGASSQKLNSGSSNGGQPKQETPAVEQPNKKNPELDWTQADVDAAVAEAKQYARDRGLIIDSSLSEKGTSWMNPIDTRLDAKTRVNSDLHYQIENSLTGIPDELIEAGIVTINIFSVNCGSYWEIYVVY